MRAVIDIGTNSILMLIGEVTPTGYIKEDMQKSAITRLGEALQQTGMITQKAMERSEQVLLSYRNLLEQKGVKEVTLVATEVLRVAWNREEFLKRIKNKFGWEIEILSGEEEARYSYIGARDSLVEQDEPVIVMDVGGGSSEIVLGKGSQLLAFHSIPLGAVRLWEKMDKRERLTIPDEAIVTEIIREYFKPITFLEKISAENILVGLGGTITTLVAIQEAMRVYHANVVNGYCLTRERIENLYHKLNALSIAERKKVPGLVKGREDIILYGILIFTTFMKLIPITQVIVSDRGLRFGYLKSLELGKE
jgi:exopolyphosphatase/guanosine-5'-triphosphate,3'-diphosphate pyrophosphatase